MLIIQIPILLFIGGLFFALSALYSIAYVIVKVAKWHYQTKALKMQTDLRRPIPLDRNDAWHAVNQLHGRVNDADEM